MRRRSLAREFALQVLYQIDITGEECELSLENFWQAHEGENIAEEVKAFSSGLVRGTINNLNEIDKQLTGFATNWQLKRMAVVDRNIMRMGAFELLFCPDIPPKVSINEAVELAKKYSGIEAGKFVNGVLDKVKQERQG
ncbi:MAG: transcription antitermination factor NusB [Candidatus Omnitrophota bacterium]